MSIELNGIAHIQLTVNDVKKCIPFWERFCVFLEMKPLIRSEGMIYCIGGRTGILVRGSTEEHGNERFDQDRAGLHHFCFRAREHDHIDAVYEFLKGEPDVTIVHPPETSDQFAPGYYSILFEDPDGLRIELNHVPGRGHFGKGGRLE